MKDFLIFFWAFATMFYAFYGSYRYEFSNVLLTMESLFAVFLGGKDTFALVQLKHYGFAINRCGCRICQRH